MTLLIWKLLKFLGISLFAAGSFAALFSQKPRQRALAAHSVTTLGFVLTWLAGYGMMKTLGYKMSTPWISISLLACLFGLGAALGAVGHNKSRPLFGAIAASAYSLSLTVMIFRTGDWKTAAILVVPIAFALGFILTKPLVSSQEEDMEIAKTTTLRWFIWLARVEGVSLLVLFGIFMPLKYGAGIQIDGGNGWIGWVHGIFQLMYVVGLIVTTRFNGWSLSQAALGFVASLLPFGTFLFERRISA